MHSACSDCGVCYLARAADGLLDVVEVLDDNVFVLFVELYLVVEDLVPEVFVVRRLVG